jgi:hypothetical protein
VEAEDAVEPQKTPETDLKSPLEIINIRNLLGTAHWPTECACCLAPTENTVELFTYFDSPPEKVPYCNDCARHPEGETRLSESDYFHKESTLRRHSALVTWQTSERKAFTGDFFKVFHVVFLHRTVGFDPAGPAVFRFYNVEYAKRFANVNGLDWPEILKQNTVEKVQIDYLRGCLRFLKFPAIFLAVILFLSLLLYVLSRFS